MDEVISRSAWDFDESPDSSAFDAASIAARDTVYTYISVNVHLGKSMAT
jgi:hypothetical protein